MKIHQLIAALKIKDQQKEVEAIVIGTDGSIQVFVVEGLAGDISDVLKLFKSNKK